MSRLQADTERIERLAILGAMVKCNGNRVAASVMLGVDHTTVFRRLKDFERATLADPDYRAWCVANPELNEAT